MGDILLDTVDEQILNLISCTWLSKMYLRVGPKYYRNAPSLWSSARTLHGLLTPAQLMIVST